MGDSEQIYTWLDTLGFPDLARCPYVKAATGGCYVRGTDLPQKSFAYGFLVEEGPSFRIFDADSLAHASFTRTPPGTEYFRSVYHEPASLREETERWLAERGGGLRQPEGVKNNPSHMGPWLRAAVLRAWPCARQGLSDLANELFALAERLQAEYLRHHAGYSLRQHLSDEIAHVLMWHAIASFACPEVSRRELLGRFEDILAKFPVPPERPSAGNEQFGWVPGGHVPHAQMATALLRRMIAEDEEHARSERPFEELSRTERIAELLFQLREQNGRQTCDPGSCDVFDDDRGDRSPAHRLVAFGYAAVPQLIAALEDERFTRSIGHHRSYYFSHHVLRVGDCALDILERVAGRSFWRGTYTNAAMVKDGEAAGTRRKVREWWDELQRDGEMQQLARAVSLGDWDSTSQAARLIEKYPEAALAAIDQGVKAAVDTRVRCTLVWLAGRLSGEQVTEWLWERLEDTGLSSRVAAARVLWSRGEAAALARMIEEWRRLPDRREMLIHTTGSDTESIHAWNQVCNGPFDLMYFLVVSRAPEAVRALADELHRLPVGHRFHLLEALASSGSVWVSWGESFWELPPESPELSDAIDALLGQYIDDNGVRTGMGGIWMGKNVSDPRLGDLAAHVLSRRWHQPSRFDLEAPSAERERRRVGLQNMWRRRNGPSVLSLPAGGEPSQRPAELAFVVEHMTLWFPGFGTPEPLKRATDALHHKPLTTEAIRALLVAATQAVTEDENGFRLTIEREGDDAGAEIGLTVEGRNAFSGDPYAGWEITESVRIGQEVVHAASDRSPPERGRSAEQWHRLAPVLERALRTSPDVRVSIHVTAGFAQRPKGERTGA